MKRRVWAIASIAPAAFATYACSTDSFQSSDAGDDGGDATTGTDSSDTTTQSDFCDAEATYYARCDPRACNSDNVKNCGAVFSDLNGRVARAIVDCQSAIACGANENIFNAFVQSTCLVDDLEGGLTSSTLANLASEVCAKCDPTNPNCATHFVSLNPLGAGSLVGLFNDTIIGDVNQTCTKDLDGGTGDAGVSACIGAYFSCSIAVIGIHVPSDKCADAN